MVQTDRQLAQPAIPGRVLYLLPQSHFARVATQQLLVLTSLLLA
jgi:hypothetical protein